MKINQNEIEIQGSWQLIGSSIKADSISERIELLITQYLIELAKDESGWYTLFQDPEDNRYWELSYPESELHGGGAPCLKCLLESEAREKYIFIAL